MLKSKYYARLIVNKSTWKLYELEENILLGCQ